MMIPTITSPPANFVEANREDQTSFRFAGTKFYFFRICGQRRTERGKILPAPYPNPA